MNSDLMSHFSNSLKQYLDSVGIETNLNAVKISSTSDGDISIYCNQFAFENENEFVQLMKDQDWELPIDEISIRNHKLSIRLNRPETFARGLRSFSNRPLPLGVDSVRENKTINIVYDSQSSLEDLTNYRIKLVVEILQNLSRAAGYSVSENDHNVRGLYFTNKSNLSRSTQSNHKIVICGPVLNSDQKTKETIIAIDQYRDLKKGILLREMEDRNKIDDEVCASLADAIVKFDFLRVKLSSPISLNVSNSSITSSAGSAVFVMYNYSRLNAIIHEFEDQVAKEYYPPLPSVESVDFSSLKEDKEWTLMLNFVLNFSTVIANSVRFIQEGKPSLHLLCTFLYSLARTVSSYYRSTKILLEGKPHLLPIMYARLYLIKAVHLMLRKGLELLSIKVIPAL